ncbi:MAG: KTSC domain-containing protein [Hyphomicrobium sp.]
MATWNKDVYSSNVQNVAYNSETKELLITWTRGKRSVYAGVPEELAVELVNAPSVGSMLNSEVKPYYAHRYG